jgi:hypothetical protein
MTTSIISCAGRTARKPCFTSITYFTSLDAVRAFAGDDYERAVVEQATRQVLSRRDERASHHEVAVDLQ